ncbi:MAG: glycosyltransferase family 9 protein [Candidatus Omnitrophota bacterium]|jgi:heptosyltransferase-2
MKLSNVRKILFITLSNIGDVILTLPVLSALKDSFPDASIDVVVGPRPEQVFKKDPRIKEVFVYHKRAGLKDKMKFIKKLKAAKYDLAIDMKASLLPVFIAAKKRTRLFTKRRAGVKHKRIMHLESLRQFGIKYREQKNIHIDEDSKNNINNILKDKGVGAGDTLIGVSPGSRSHLKQWKKQGFIDVIRGILKNPKNKVVLIGDANDAALSSEIAGTVNRPDSLIDLTARTSLSELFALIERFDLLLTCDSAAMHIASDLGIKVAAIFGPTDPAEYGPRGEKNIVIRKNLECSPCKKAQCEFGTHECMYSISADEVLEAINKICGHIS